MLFTGAQGARCVRSAGRRQGQRRTKNVRVKAQQQRRSLFEVSLGGGRSSVSGVVATVFGCTGFLGRYVVNQLGRMGSQVVLPYRGEESSYTHLKVMGDLGQLVPMRWDLRDKDSIRKACQHSNVVINLTGRRYDTRNFTQREVHVDAAQRIAEVANELGIQRLIHVSALGGDTSSECDWLKTKAEGEIAVKKAFPQATIIRAGTIFGAQDKFLNHHAQMLRLWPVYPLVNPSQKVQPVWANDVALGIVHTLKSPDAEGQIYEAVGSQAITLHDLAKWLDYVLKTRAKMVEVNDNVLWHLGYWLGQHRRPRYTLDSIKDTGDKLPSGQFPTLLDLGVEPQGLLSPLGLSFVIHYRPPLHVNDLKLGPVPEILEGIEGGRPLF